MLHPTPHKKLLTVVVSLALWATLIWLDLATGIKVRFGPVYAIPVLLTAYYLGRGWGIVSAFTSALLWHGIHMVVLQNHTFTFFQYWDLTLGILSFSTIAFAAFWFRMMFERVEATNLELHQALEQIKTLEGMLPICAWCRKVRDDQGFWEQIETYVSKHSNTTWTHGICPECAAKFKEHDLI